MVNSPITDIVARLRAENADPRYWRRMYGEAADEIERLRAALQKIRNLYDTPDILFDAPLDAGLDVIYDIVRVALKEPIQYDRYR
jgi:hypothetical protein